MARGEQYTCGDAWWLPARGVNSVQTPRRMQGRVNEQVGARVYACARWSGSKHQQAAASTSWQQTSALVAYVEVPEEGLHVERPVDGAVGLGSPQSAPLHFTNAYEERRGGAMGVRRQAHEKRSTLGVRREGRHVAVQIDIHVNMGVRRNEEVKVCGQVNVTAS
jgi:hypothetical protein